jgi:hypothetical protein
MARSSTQIQNQILAEVANQPLLAPLNSTSQSAIWRLWVNVFAAVQNVNEQLWDVKQTELEKIAAESVAGTAAWLQRQVLNFQFGDQIVVNPNYSVSYPVTDASKRIVSRCSVKQLPEDRVVLVKVAKGTQSALQPLAQPERDALTSYVHKVQFAGTYITVISLEADRLTADIDVFFDAEYVQSVVKANVVVAINEFLKNLEFDGVLHKNQLQNAIEAVPGVLDLTINGLVARPYLTSRNDPTVTPFERIYETDAGYIIAETDTGYTLNDTINMIPN